MQLHVSKFFRLLFLAPWSLGQSLRLTVNGEESLWLYIYSITSEMFFSVENIPQSHLSYFLVLTVVTDLAKIMFCEMKWDRKAFYRVHSALRRLWVCDHLPISRSLNDCEEPRLWLICELGVSDSCLLSHLIKMSKNVQTCPQNTVCGHWCLTDTKISEQQSDWEQWFSNCGTLCVSLELLGLPQWYSRSFPFQTLTVMCYFFITALVMHLNC